MLLFFNKGSWSPRVEDALLESPQMAESPIINVSARNDSESDDGIKRRGKRRKRGGKKQGGSELEREFQGLKEPGETQVFFILKIIKICIYPIHILCEIC